MSNKFKYICVICSFLAVITFGLTTGILAAKNANVNGNSTITYAGGGSSDLPDETEIKTANNTLNNGGFTVSTPTNGKPTIAQNNQLGGWGGYLPENQARPAHDSLMGRSDTSNQAARVLSYVSYDYKLCEAATGATFNADGSVAQNGTVYAVLDFSNTNIEIFSYNFLNAMVEVVYSHSNFTFNEPIMHIGEDGKSYYLDVNNTKQYVDGAAKYWFETVNDEEEAYITNVYGKKVEIKKEEIPLNTSDNMAFRLILPNYAIANGREVEFEEASLDIAIKPLFIALDLSYLQMQADGNGNVLGVSVSPKASSYKGLHLHFITIGGTSAEARNQMHYAFTDALNYLFADNALSGISGVDFADELFVKPSKESAVSQLVAGVKAEETSQYSGVYTKTLNIFSTTESIGGGTAEEIKASHMDVLNMFAFFEEYASSNLTPDLIKNILLEDGDKNKITVQHVYLSDRGTVGAIGKVTIGKVENADGSVASDGEVYCSNEITDGNASGRVGNYRTDNNIAPFPGGGATELKSGL